MDYGRDDGKRWTVRREEPEDGPLAWLFAHAVLLVMGVALGALGGAFLPLIIANAPGESAYQRQMNQRVGGPTAGDRVGEALEGAADARLRRSAWDAAASDTGESAKGRAVVGGGVGLVAALGLAYASRKKR